MNIDLILDANLTPTQLAELAVAAERGGIRTLWHPNMHACRDALVALVPAAMATSRIRLGVLAVSPFELHPVKIATSLLTLNEIAGGRATVAIGGGGSVLSAIRQDGIQLDYRKLRVVAGVREATEIVRAAAAGTLTKPWAGELFHVTRPARTNWGGPVPAQVFTAADGPQMTRLAGRLADGVMFGDLTIHRAAEVMENIRAGMAKRERQPADFRVVNYWAWHIKQDREHSLYEARRGLVWRTQIVPPWHGLAHILPPEEAQLVRDHFEDFARAFWTRSGKIENVPAELVSRLIRLVSSSGDHGDIDGEIERYAELARAGFTDLALKVFDEPMAALEVICERVVPRLAVAS